MRWYKKLFGRQKEVKSLKKDESFDIYFQELEDKRWDNWIELEADRIFSEREEKRELAKLIPDSPLQNNTPSLSIIINKTKKKSV